MVVLFAKMFKIFRDIHVQSSKHSAQVIFGAEKVPIVTFGKSSGGNFNPAVSVALGLSGKMHWSEVGIYAAVQLVGGIAAGLGYLAVSQALVSEPGFLQLAHRKLIGNHTESIGTHRKIIVSP